jgi:hypothetical protein
MAKMINLENENAELRNTTNSVCDLFTDKMTCLSGLFCDRIADIENRMQANFTCMKDQFRNLHGVGQVGVEVMQLRNQSTVPDFEINNSSEATPARSVSVPVQPTTRDTQQQSVTHDRSSLKGAGERSSQELFTDRMVSQQASSVSGQQLYTETFASEINTDGEFQLHQSRGVRKRARQASRDQTSSRQISVPTRVQVIGRHSGQQCKIKSSGRIVGKRVFAVTNVACDYTADDMISFLSDKHLTVVSCFEAKTKFNSSKSFRICVASTDVDKFLDPEMWPEHVIVRDWFFSV